MPPRNSPTKRFLLFAAIAAAAVGASILIVPLASGTNPAPTERWEPQGGPAAAPEPKGAGCPGSINPDLCAIEHVIFIVQENRSFDHYFGMYESPGGGNVNGIPTKPNGSPKGGTCNPHPVLNKCLLPYHTSKDVNLGGPHGHKASVIDVNRGAMNGFIKGAASGHFTRRCTLDPYRRSCRKFQGPARQPDAMSYRLRKDIQNYHALADYGVLMDRLFMSVDSYTLPAHMFIFSGWAATCSGGPMTCKGSNTPDPNGNFNWTPIAYLLDQDNVSWAWYVGEDTNICNNYPFCPQKSDDDFSPTNWNPPPGFNYIKDANQLDHILPVSDFKQSLTNDTLPAVTWIIPSERDSEHPGKGSMRPGYNYVTDLVERIGNSAAWDNTAVYLYWDDWGGFYDHVKPLRIDNLGYGIRVPGILISPYAKEGYVDHQTLSPDAFLKFIEDRFLDGKRLDPDAPYMPADARPGVREEAEQLGDVTSQFDFSQPPRPAPVLPE